MPVKPLRTWALAHYAVTLLVAVLVLAAGLTRFGLWQPAELHIADLARGDGNDVESRGHPPLQTAAVHWGFRTFGPNERGGRLPAALFAVLATMVLALAVGSVTDARSGAMVGVVYATTPLVFMNARQMFGGGIAQSSFTLFFACALLVLWARPPPGRWTTAWNYGRWLLLSSIVLPIYGAGWLDGAVPVLLGSAVAVAIRVPFEPRVRTLTALVFAAVGGVTAVRALAAMYRPIHGYQPLLGVGPDAHAQTLFQTHDVLIEQIGHATFPWTALVAFGLVRLVLPPPPAAENPSGSTSLDDDDALWRATGLRVTSVMVAIAALGFQTLRVQQFGLEPFIAAAPLAIACALTLRDAEREAKPWRLVTAMMLLTLLCILRDYELFEKSSYAALGLPDGGPMFPTGFTGKLADWWRAHSHSAVSDIFAGRAIGEIYFVVWAGLFGLLALPALFQGAGEVHSFGWARPYTWLLDVERWARSQVERETAEGVTVDDSYRNVTLGPFVHFRVTLMLFAMAIAGGAWLTLRLDPRINPQIGGLIQPFQYLPVAVVVATIVIVPLWNLFAFVGAPESEFARIVGSRITWVFVGGLLSALFYTQVFMPAISEHLSPRGAWAVVRQLRRGNEPVARFAIEQGSHATRYYADFDVTDLTSEAESVNWLRQTSPPHFLVVGVDAFASLNHAYRETFPAGQRHNVPVADVSGTSQYVAVSALQGREDRSPLATVVLNRDTLTGTSDHWHVHGRRGADRQIVGEPARFGDAIEYLGYNLDSNNLSYVPIGGNFRIRYHFHVLRELPADYRIFVHLEGACSHQTADHVGGGGKYPVRFWLAGDFIHDEQQVTVPTSCHAGTMTLYLGFFLGTDRLPATGGEHDADNRVVAAAINVR